MWRHEISYRWRHSPYFLRGEGQGSTRPKRKADYVQSYRELEAAAAAASDGTHSGELAKCTLTMTLDPHYFPEELWGQQSQRGARSAAAEKAYWAEAQKRRAAAREATEGDLHLGKLEEMARREAKVGGDVVGVESAGCAAWRCVRWWMCAMCRSACLCWSVFDGG